MIVKDISAWLGLVSVVIGVLVGIFTLIGKVRLAFGRKRLGKPVATDTPGADPARRPWVVGLASRDVQAPK